jgi:hypothetical protein
VTRLFSSLLAAAPYVHLLRLPFSFSSEVQALLGAPDSLNLTVMAAFPELEDSWHSLIACPLTTIGEAPA